MRKGIVILVISLWITATAVVDGSLAFERPLKLEFAQTGDIKGTFRLVLYGGRYSNDLENLAILDLEGDDYTFEPYAPDFDYRVIKGVPAEEALRKAELFVSSHPAFSRAQISRILDYNGKTIGYEVRPLYQPLAFGLMDVLDVNYWPENGKVIVKVHLIPSVERMIIDGDGGAGKSD